jgi:hypothetical protein
MRLKPTTIILALACLGITSACSRSPAPNTGTAAAPVVTKLEVDNQGFLDMNIYVLRGPAGSRLRLGSASGSSKTTLTIPETVLLAGGTPLKFLADPIGGRRPSVSTTIVVNHGDVVTLRIPPG